MPIYKMYGIVAKESLDKMGGNRGKLCTQLGHAYLHSWWDAMHRTNLGVAYNDKATQAKLYRESQRAYKITLVVDTVDELMVLHNSYKNICGTSLVEDAGFTVFSEPTITCLGIGPIRDNLIGDDLKALKVLI